ncbi:MAG TPA: hypothetical protein VKA68_04700 [bacterium]|nr:hypothetical protein [bacterium]
MSTTYGIGLESGQWSLSNGLNAGRYEADLIDENHASEEHTGSQRYIRDILSLGCGFSPRWNGFFDIPYEYRVQRVDDESPHHQNETLAAPGDLHLRVNYLWENSVFGPGWRIYTGAGLILPTGSSYNSNVFVPEADSVFHSHMVTGLGNYQMTFRCEIYYRSNFPVAGGLILNGRFPVWISENTYSLGTGWSVLWANYLQSLRILASVPRLNLLVSAQIQESWGSQEWPNSGGWKIDAQVGWITELSENWTGAFEVSVPIYQNFQGSQLSGTGMNVTIRYIF